jgi:hypothetical protein
MKTIGVFGVAALAASAVAVPSAATITATPRSQHWQSFVPTFRPTILDCHVSALCITSFGQALVESGDQIAPGIQRRRIEKSDHWHRSLLRARRGRPRGCCPEQRDKLAPSHGLPLT